MPRPAPKPSGLTKAPRKEHPVAPESTRKPAGKQDGPGKPAGDVKVLSGSARLSTVLPADLHKAVKVKSIEQDRSIQDVVTEALQEWLARQA